MNWSRKALQVGVYRNPKSPDLRSRNSPFALESLHAPVLQHRTKRAVRGCHQGRLILSNPDSERLRILWNLRHDAQIGASRRLATPPLAQVSFRDSLCLEIRHRRFNPVFRRFESRQKANHSIHTI
jgi:hypothetical protein